MRAEQGVGVTSYSRFAYPWAEGDQLAWAAMGITQDVGVVGVPAFVWSTTKGTPCRVLRLSCWTALVGSTD
jgi:hypothetical protein